MTNRREHISVEIKKVEQRTSSARGRWASHMKEKHNGIAATSCHTCLFYKGNIEGEEAYIRELRNELHQLASI